jgi:hypothetical protein
MATVGCPRNCAEATVKDIGLIGVEGGWQVVVGGAAGKSVRKADLLTTVETTEQALEASELFFQYYRENANYLERTYDFVERLGIEKVRKETVYAPDAARDGLLDRYRKSKARAEGRLAGRPIAATPHAVRPRSRCWHEMDACDRVRQHPPREGRAVSSPAARSRSSISVTASSPWTISARTRPVRSPTASSPVRRLCVRYTRGRSACLMAVWSVRRPRAIRA